MGAPAVRRPSRKTGPNPQQPNLHPYVGLCRYLAWRNQLTSPLISAPRHLEPDKGADHWPQKRPAQPCSSSMAAAGDYPPPPHSSESEILEHLIPYQQTRWLPHRDTKKNIRTLLSFWTLYASWILVLSIFQSRCNLNSICKSGIIQKFLHSINISQISHFKLPCPTAFNSKITTHMI